MVVFLGILIIIDNRDERKRWEEQRILIENSKGKSRDRPDVSSSGNKIMVVFLGILIIIDNRDERKRWEEPDGSEEYNPGADRGKNRYVKRL